MIIDCDRCDVRGPACGDCVMGVLIGVPAAADGAPVGPQPPSAAPVVQLDAPERRALAVLADQGLVPHLRLVPAPRVRTDPSSDLPESVRDAG